MATGVAQSEYKATLQTFQFQAQPVTQLTVYLKKMDGGGEWGVFEYLLLYKSNDNTG